MYQLRKIKELNGYRFFQRFKWDESNCKLFAENNIIYGWNGSGKTTLCDFLKALVDQTALSDEIRFSLLFEDTDSHEFKPINKNQLETIPYRICVFHHNYIRDNISAVDHVKHIFSVGKEQTDRIIEVKELKEEVRKQSSRLKSLQNDLSAKKGEFEKFKAEKAKLIKDTVSYNSSYNKNKFYDSFKKLKDKQTLTEEEYKRVLSSVHAEKREPINTIRADFIQSTVEGYVSDILSETPTNKTIDSLKNDYEQSKWLEQGLSLHAQRQSNICLFCGNQISNQRFDQLRAHFNKSYKDLCDRIDNTINLLNNKINEFEISKTSLPDSALFYPELKGEYILLQSNAIEICDKYINAILQIIEILKNKKSDIINLSYLNEFAMCVNELSFDYSVFNKINDIIKKHNEITERFQESIREAQHKIEIHYLSNFSDSIITFEEEIEKKGKEIDVLNNSIISSTQDIIKLEQEIKNSQISADEINKDIAFIMGRSELVFENTDLGYKITRNGKRATNLSTGEENAIALIYFFNSLLDVDSDINNTIIVLDDPISSFDSNFYYNAISYIKEKSDLAGQTFVFTHKFSLYKDYSLMFKDNTNRYTIKRVQNAPQLVNEDSLINQFHDEYAYLFKKIYDFVKDPPKNTTDYLQYPNMARRLLEAFLTFKLPYPSGNRTMIDKVLEIEKDNNTAAGRAVLRLLNNRSHLRIITDNDNSDDIDTIVALPDILLNLLEFIKLHDETHYNTLAALCDPLYQEEGKAVEIIRPKTFKVSLYKMAASAGYGDYLDNNLISDEFEVNNPNCSFAVKISGDSMEPDICDGSIALVKECEEIPNAHKGIAWYKGVCYCKKVVQTKNGVLLVSTNQKYPNIEIIDYDEYHLFGEVIDVMPSIDE